MPFVESKSEFISRHGDYIPTGEGSHEVWYFEDGAKLESSWHGWNPHPPPPGGDDLLLAKRCYVVEKLRQEEHRYNNYLSDALQQLRFYERGMGPPPHPQAEECLDRGRERIAALRARLEELDKQVSHTLRSHRRENDRRARAERRARAAERRSHLEQYRETTIDSASISPAQQALTEIVDAKLEADKELIDLVTKPPQPARPRFS